MLKGCLRSSPAFSNTFTRYVHFRVNLACLVADLGHIPPLHARFGGFAHCSVPNLAPQDKVLKQRPAPAPVPVSLIHTSALNKAILTQEHAQDDYYPRLYQNKRHHSWELEDAQDTHNSGGRGRVPSTICHPGVDGYYLLTDTVVYCAAERLGLEELKRLALIKQGLRFHTLG